MNQHHLKKQLLLLSPAIVLFACFTAYAQGPPQSYQGIRFDYNTQRQGGDYTHFRTPRFEDCAEACANDRRCQAIDFNINDNSCWLKDRVPPPRPSRNIASGVKESSGYNAGGEENMGGGYNSRGGGNTGGGYAAPQPAQRPNAIGDMEITPDLKRNGGDYTNFRARNVEECAQACSRDYNCQAFNYGKRKSDCWLKNTVPQGVPNNTVISGFRRR